MARPNKVNYEIIYNGKKITKDIATYVTGITFTDNIDGQSDELTISMHDQEGKWLDVWYPTKGDFIEFSFGYNDGLLDAGKFTVDEIVSSGGSSGDTIEIKAIASGINNSVRTKTTRGFEELSLRDIAAQIASENGLQLIGDVPLVNFNRVTQNNETDLSFLRRISFDYGALFSIKGDRLVFENIYSIEKNDTVFTLDRTDLKSYSITNTTTNVYREAKSGYYNQASKSKIESIVKALSTDYTKDVPVYENPTTPNTAVGPNEQKGAEPAISDDTDKVYGGSVRDSDVDYSARFENALQAQEKSKANLHRKNTKQISGTINVVGFPKLIAGVNIRLTGLGRVSGKYNITQSTHSFSRSGGYDTSVQVKRVSKIDFVDASPAKLRPIPKRG